MALVSVEAILWHVNCDCSEKPFVHRDDFPSFDSELSSSMGYSNFEEARAEMLVYMEEINEKSCKIAKFAVQI